MSDKMICVYPQVFGQTADSPAGPSEFQTILPAKQPGATQFGDRRHRYCFRGLALIGIRFRGIPPPSIHFFDDARPIYAERAETIGRPQVLVGTTYQYLHFDSLDGVKLKTSRKSSRSRQHDWSA